MWQILRHHLLLGFAVLCVPTGYAATITAASTSRSDVANAISASSVGDTVLIPAGTSTWNSQITITKGLNIFGAGTNSTKLINGTSAGQGLESPVFNIDLSADRPVRISGIWFQDSGNNYDSDGIDVNGSIHETAVRIDHCVFERFSFAVKVHGAFGVCDHCTFLNNDVIGRTAGYLSSSHLKGFPAPPWAWDSADYWVYEDCQGIYTSWSRNTYLFDTEYPVNYMVRHCDFQINRSAAVVLDGLDMHGNADGSLNPMGLVCYANTWTFTGNNTVNGCRLADIRGGVGSLVYSNSCSGVEMYCSVRDNPASSPLMSNTYIWGNVANGQNVGVEESDGVTQNINWFASKPANFAQLRYPHPLVTGGGGPSTNPIIAISPASYDFGSLAVGSASNATFTVRNVGGGTLTGTVSVGLPFSILGSSSYSLGSNASQIVTVRYLPTLAGNDGKTVAWTGGGGASATVNGSGWAVLSSLSFDSTAGTISGPFTIGTDQTVSQSVQTLDPASGGLAVYRFSITNAADYIVSAAVYGPADDANSFFVNIDAEPTDPAMIWDFPMDSGFANRTVTWRSSGGVSPQVWHLGVGTHQLIVRGREAGAKLGHITISKYDPAAPGRPSAPTSLHILASIN